MQRLFAFIDHAPRHMENDLSRPELLKVPLQRIAVFRALMLGDMLCVIPAIRALRHAFPQAEITLVGLPWAAEIVTRFPMYFDRFLAFPGFPGMPEREPDVKEFPQFFLQAQQERFDLALQLHGSGRFTNSIVMLMGGRATAGFYEQDGYRPNSEWFFPYPTELHEVHRNLHLAELLGIPACGEALEFPVTAEDEDSYCALPVAEQLGNEPFVCIHPGARSANRRWPQEYFAHLADGLANHGYHIVITGSVEEIGLANAVQAAMTAKAINLAGQTSLGTLAALLRRCALLVCNDTGVSHVAAALRAPSVILVTCSDPARWAPLDRQLHRVVTEPAACRPRQQKTSAIGLPSASRITVERVMAEAMAALGAAGHQSGSEQTKASADVERIPSLVPGTKGRS